MLNSLNFNLINIYGICLKDYHAQGVEKTTS